MTQPESARPPGVPHSVKTTGAITFIGTATVLMEVGGFTILTDPNFVHRHEKVPLGHGLEATRLTDPSMEIADLPPLDCVVLSHFHGDHFDQVAERELDKGLPILTTSQAASELAARGFTNARGLDTWQSTGLTKDGATLTVTAMPGAHGPGIIDFALPDVMGSVLEMTSAAGASQLRMYITGDTLMIDALQEVPRRMGDMDLALIHLGGTKVLGILVSMDDDQGVRLIQTIKPQLAVPIHYDDYDVFKSPLSDFRARVQEAGLAQQVRYVDHGERFEFALPWTTADEPLARRGDNIAYEWDSATGKGPASDREQRKDTT